MAVLIGIGGAILIVIGRSEDLITNSITTTVVMVVAGISPQRAWEQPILRLFDTLIGVAVGITAVAISMRLSHHTTSDNRAPLKEKSQWETTKQTL
jgi:formate/nitrite transporter FocA (FNT family)